jgi:CRISP-associated protein Cas1
VPLQGRLGLDTARVPHTDRHGCLWLRRGALTAADGTLEFVHAGSAEMPAGRYAIPFQAVSAILLEPGTTVSHDALRLLARHGTALVVCGEDGVRLYASLPSGTDESARARAQVRAWSDEKQRLAIARRMYAWRLGEVLAASDISVLRGIEGSRVKTMYRNLAQQYDIHWSGRRYDRDDPEATDRVNQALNHASTAVRAAAMVAVAATSTIPQLGFIHEDSAKSFCLDIADLFRDDVALHAAFTAVKQWERSNKSEPLERHARRTAGRQLQQKQVIPAMIDRIEQLFGESIVKP